VTLLGRLLGCIYFCIGALAAAWAILASTGLLGSTKAGVWRQRLGIWNGDAQAGAGRGDGEACVWLHAASVGEVAAARPLLRALRVRLPSRFLLVTCNTATGVRAAEALDCDAVHYFPLDFFPVVRWVVARVRPSVFVFVETELWPTLLGVLERSGTSTAMVNARISERSFPRYQRIEALLRPALAGIDVFCARDESSRRRLITLGASTECTTLVGDMKLDALAPAVVNATGDLLAELMGITSAHGEGAVLVAASTRTGEEALVLDAFERVLEKHGSARLVIAPRHPDRFDAVAELLEERSHAFVRRSSGASALRAHERWQVLLLDSVGELRGCFPGATAAFVGGSLVPVGGHNVLEPAAFGVPVVVGPHLEDVSEQAVALAEAGALRVVNDSRELAEVWIAWIADPGARRRAGESGAACVAAGRGAVQDAMERLEPLLVRRSSPGPR
jgi:3-deoxy-D-manno-octulosonic-acid transferase